MRELAQQTPQRRARRDAPLTQQDLEAMLDRMEDTARNGAREDAEAMLDQMQNMFENMRERDGRAGRPGRARTAQADGRTRQAAARSAGAARRDVPRDQREQRGRDFRSDLLAAANRTRRSRHRPPKSAAKPIASDETGSEQLARGRQRALRDRLAEMQRRLKALGLKGEKGFDDAQGDMKEAEGDLKGDGRPGSAETGRRQGEGRQPRRGRKGKSRAVDAQGRALQALREGAQGLQQQMQGRRPGRTATGRRRRTARRRARDPLGRGPGGQRGATKGH